MDGRVGLAVVRCALALMKKRAVESRLLNLTFKEINPMRSPYLLTTLIVAGLTLVISLPSPADEAPSKEKIDKLIELMGSGTFSEREKATKELAAIGVPALDALRKAAKSDDAEVRKRAEELMPKIEARAESIRVLAPKRVHLVYKNTPLSEAVADFQKKSGYTLRLHDPDEKLKDRKITLDTGDTTFWHALELFCDKAQLTEASMQDLMQVPRPPLVAPGGVAPGLPPAPVPPRNIKPLPPVRKPGLAAPAAEAPPARAVKPAQVQVAPAAPPIAPKPAVIRPGRVVMPMMPMMPGMPGMSGQIVLKDGKAKKRPTDDRGAVRVRALRKSDMFGNTPEGEVIVALEVSPEPRLQWQTFQSVRIEKVVDDQDQKLSQVIPQVEGGVGGFGVGVPPGPGAAVVGRAVMVRPIMMWGGLQQMVPVQLKKGAKAAKSLKELKGVITAQMLTEARPMITADKLDKAAGKVFKGEVGGSIKILNVKAEKQQTTIRLEFEQPPYDKVIPAQPNPMPGVGVPIRVPRPGVRILPAPVPPARVPPARPAPAAPPAGLAAKPPAPPPPPAPQPPAVQIQIGVGGGGGIAFAAPGQFVGPLNGLSVQDDKGNSLPIQVRQTQFRMMQQGNGVPIQTITYTFVCQHGKDKGQPAKVVYLGRKRVTVDIPFTLKDVPLP